MAFCASVNFHGLWVLSVFVPPMVYMRSSTDLWDKVNNFTIPPGSEVWAQPRQHFSKISSKEGAKKQTNRSLFLLVPQVWDVQPSVHYEVWSDPGGIPEGVWRVNAQAVRRSGWDANDTGEDLFGGELTACVYICIYMCEALFRTLSA